MRILAIETSCDETAAAVVEDGWKVLSSVIASSLDLHKKTGGVVPEVAARAQLEAIIPVLEETLNNAFPKKTKEEQKDFLDAIAVTNEPGLITSLLIGTETAKWLSYLWKKPLIKVNHIRGHVYANWLERDPKKDLISFPVICLSVSGGHNDLILLKSHKDFEIIGQTEDDAAGEAFDKVARVLGLGYPGGPEIEKIAAQHVIKDCHPEQEESDARRRCEGSLNSTNTKFFLGQSPKQSREDCIFPRAWLNTKKHLKTWDGSSFNFSFSGLKSEVIREAERRTGADSVGMTRKNKEEIAYAFQEAVFDVLSIKLIGAAKKFGTQEIHLAGGVSANKRFRKLIQEHMEKEHLNIPFRTPKKMQYCTDNAAMIGAAAYFMK